MEEEKAVCGKRRMASTTEATGFKFKTVYGTHKGDNMQEKREDVVDRLKICMAHVNASLERTVGVQLQLSQNLLAQCLPIECFSNENEDAEAANWRRQENRTTIRECVMQIATIKTFQPGEVICSAGPLVQGNQDAERMYFVLDGIVEER